MDKLTREFVDYLDYLNTPIIEVSDTKNGYLYPQYKHIEYTFGKIYKGVIITDRQGTYTPIEKHYRDILHLYRIPRVGNDVYAITDLRSIVYTVVGSLVIVFQGVYQTACSGYDFIDNSFFIRPIPGMSFNKQDLIFHLSTIDRKNTQVIYDSIVDEVDDYD